MLDEQDLEVVLVNAERGLPGVRADAAAKRAAREPAAGRVLEQFLVDDQLLVAEIRDLDLPALRAYDQLPVEVLANGREHCRARRRQRARLGQVVLQLLAATKQRMRRAQRARNGGAGGGAGAGRPGAHAEARVRRRREHLPHVVLELLQETHAAVCIARRGRGPGNAIVLRQAEIHCTYT